MRASRRVGSCVAKLSDVFVDDCTPGKWYLAVATATDCKDKTAKKESDCCSCKKDIDWWDNGDPNGYSNIRSDCFGIDRTLLDDFTVDGGGWDISSFEWHHVWDSAHPPFGTGATFSLLDDNGGVPGGLIGSANITSYTEVPTGNNFFSRPEVLSTIVFDPVYLHPGKYWFEGTICGDDNNFWLIHQNVQCSECWINYADLDVYGPGSSLFGVPADMAWTLSGPDGGDDQFTFYCDPSDGHANNQATIQVSGNVLSQGPIHVSLTGGPPGQFSYLLVGNNNGIVKQPPGAKGDLCIIGGNCLGRYASDIGQISSGGSFVTDIESSL